MKTFFALLAVVCLLVISCTPSCTSDSTKLSGSFQGLTSDNLYLKSTSDSTISSKIQVINSKFNVDIDIDKPTWFQLLFRKEECRSHPVSIELFLEPGDQIQLSGDAKNLYTSILASGKGEEENNFLFSKFNIYYPECTGWPPSVTLEVKDYLAELNSMNAAFEKSIIDFNKSGRMNKHFVDFETRKNEYRYAYTKCIYPSMHKKQNGKYPDGLAKDFYQYLNELDYSEEEVYYSQTKGNKYVYLVSWYFSYLEDLGKGGVVGLKETLLAIDDKVESQRIKNSLLKFRMEDGLDQLDHSEIKDILIKYNKKITDEKLKVRI